MNFVARTQLIFQMIILLQKYQYHQSQCSKTWGSKCLALMAQMVRAFGMNPNVGSSSPTHAETCRHVENECCCRAQLTFQMLTLLQKVIYRLLSATSVIVLFKNLCKWLWQDTKLSQLNWYIYICVTQNNTGKYKISRHTCIFFNQISSVDCLWWTQILLTDNPVI